MKRCLGPVFLMLSLSAAVAFAALDKDGDTLLGKYRLLRTLAIPGGLAGFDIAWADSANARFYLADRGNPTATPPVGPTVDVIDTEHDQYLASIPLTAGANGVLAIPRAHEIWVGLSDSTVAVISSDTYAVEHVISTGGTARADELAYDPADHLILIANDRDTPPFVTFISTETNTVVKRLSYDGMSAPQSTGGIEQSVWDGAVGKFYISIPATSANATGEVDEIDPQEMSVTRSFPTTCSPAGLALVPGKHLITSCGDVLDATTGVVLETIRGVAGDEIWYNPGDERVYFGSGTDRISVNVVDTDVNLPVATITVGQILAAPAVSHTTHSVAADAGNNHIFVPVSGVGVEVWTDMPATQSSIQAPNFSSMRIGFRVP